MKEFFFTNFFKDATLFLVAGASVLFFSQCRKDKNKPGKESGISTEFMVGKKWQVKAISITPGVDDGMGHVVEDLYKDLPACTKDDYVVFKADGTGTADEGAAKCDAEDPQTTTFNWSLKADGTLEGTDMDGFNGTYKAVKTNNTTITVTGTGKLGEDAVMRTLTIRYEVI